MDIRHADPERDAAACAAIYKPSVTDSVASLEERAPEPHEMADRIRFTSRSHPWLVAEIDGEVVGYAYGSRPHDPAAHPPGARRPRPPRPGRLSLDGRRHRLHR